MKKNPLFKPIVFLLSLVILLASLCVSSFADLGDFNDYSDDSGWDSGSSWDSDSSWDSGSSWDSDNDSGSYRDSSSSGSGLTYIVVIIVIIIIIMNSRKGGGGGNGSGGQKISRQGSMINVPDNTEQIVTAIKKYDPNFNCDKFLAWAKETFITLQMAWSERDFEKARPFEKEELYQQHIQQIQKLKDSGRINVLDRININQAYLFGYTRDKEYEYMKVYFMARMTDYIKDEKTGSIIKGDPNTEYHLKYIYTYMRKTGVLTSETKSNISTVACPNCGAPTAITSAGKCEYCGFIVTTGEFDWVLSDITGIKQGTNLGSGGVVDRTEGDNKSEASAQNTDDQNTNTQNNNNS